MRIVFVTGTDTDVGKTVVTAALAAQQLALGRSVAVVKPAQTGLLPGEDGDLAEVRRLAGDVETIEGMRLPDPLAPQAAARIAGVELPGLHTQHKLVDATARGHDITFVEGAGGVLVPLGHQWDLAHLASALLRGGCRVSFVVVARAGLGTLNHTALTVQAIQGRGLEVEGVIIGAWPAQPDAAAVQNLLDLPSLAGVPLLGRLPDGAARLPVSQFRHDALAWVAPLSP